MDDDDLIELLFSDLPGSFIVKGNITPRGILNHEDITIGRFQTIELARAFASMAQTEGIDLYGWPTVFTTAWVEPDAGETDGCECMMI